MQKSHINPSQAVKAAELLRAKTMLPVHFETFINSLDSPTEDRDLLKKAEEGAPPGLRIINWHIGDSVVIR